ncbi:MAG TPA: NAD(+) synthase, partial [Candidatus Atribacteria bacterium]|nr:NAD(+) synthase [Candidatus Atribacteria bacterium]
MRDYAIETQKRVNFIQEALASANASGIVFGSSGGKDSVLVGILCKKACDNTVGLIMPCSSRRNYEEDKIDAELVARQFGIELRTVDLTPVRSALLGALTDVTELTATALANIAPRLRMTTLYAVAASENRLVAGTGNRSEYHMGYFT